MKTRRTGLAFLVLLLAACNTGSPGFFGVASQTVTVGPSTFAVRRKDDTVELVRTSPEKVFSLAGIVPRATEAVIMATGCAPRAGTWTGDHAVSRVHVDCPD
ncbi:hypothetical protein [Yoonia sp.]|uniref:hypothetical protein n=1 Tax=Yoonia sp. TaxID=2212373 RepID=UPI003F6D10C9